MFLYDNKLEKSTNYKKIRSVSIPVANMLWSKMSLHFRLLLFSNDQHCI